MDALLLFKAPPPEFHLARAIAPSTQDTSYSELKFSACFSQYPHLVSGAVASSAPVQAKTDFQGYQNVSPLIPLFINNSSSYSFLSDVSNACAPETACKFSRGGEIFYVHQFAVRSIILQSKKRN